MDYDDTQIEQDLEDAVIETITKTKKEGPPKDLPKVLYIFPVVRRPFFPGMAAPVVVEPGPFYEALKVIAKSEDKCIGIALTKKEDADLSTVTLKDLHPVGVVARILRIIPMEQGGAQVILSMERRMRLLGPAKRGSKELIAKVSYHKEEVILTKELKAYAISIISTIKELLK